jgi:hypothetical protein
MINNTEKTTTESSGVFTKKLKEEIERVRETSSPDFLAGFVAGLKFTAQMMADIK